MTRLQLITAIKREGRIKNSTNLDAMIGDILDDVTRDYCNRAWNHELLQTNVAITAIAETGQYALPADFFGLKEIRFGIDSDSTRTWTLKSRTDCVRRISNQGYPYFFYLSAAGINIFPFSNIVPSNTILIDYYADPLSVFAADDDDFPVPRLEAAVKKEVIMRIDKFHADAQGAQLDSKDADSSFIASQAGK